MCISELRLSTVKKFVFLTSYWQVMPIKTRNKKGEEEIMSAGDSARLLESLLESLMI